ncbi:MAG: hypothetical protein AAGC55_32545, partial [Myxococcota bacterium]
CFVPFQSALDRACARTTASDSGPAYWANDGVHPSLAGHQVLADAWRAVVPADQTGEPDR